MGSSICEQYLILKMNRSRSARNIQSQSKSPSRRGIYINEQINKRQKHTTFHSPYKDGKPNKEYINPTFISSNLFYPKEYIEDKTISVQKNYIPNSNDIKKEALYRQRLRTDNDLKERSKTKQKQIQARTRQFRNERTNNNFKIIRLNQPQKLLSSQLECLQNYRQSLQDFNMNREKRTQQRRIEDLPPYFQKSRRDIHLDLRQDMQRREEINDWMAVSNELKELRKQMKRANVALENERTNKMIQENQNLQVMQQQKQRKQSQLLGNILREQIKTNELKKEKKWNY